jgi:hypothetical protein
MAEKLRHSLQKQKSKEADQYNSYICYYYMPI